MNTEDKAKDLFVKFFERLPDGDFKNQEAKELAKVFANIAVEEILWQCMLYAPSRAQYWKEVKNQIESI